MERVGQGLGEADPEPALRVFALDPPFMDDGCFAGTGFHAQDIHAGWQRDAHRVQLAPADVQSEAGSALRRAGLQQRDEAFLVRLKNGGAFPLQFLRKPANGEAVNVGGKDHGDGASGLRGALDGRLRRDRHGVAVLVVNESDARARRSGERQLDGTLGAARLDVDHELEFDPVLALAQDVRHVVLVALLDIAAFTVHLEGP